MSSTTDASAGRAQIAERTLRTDRWWFPPLRDFTLLVLWVAYATVRAFQQDWYFTTDQNYNYLTPFYSPCFSVGCVPEASHFGQFLPDWWFLPYAALTLPFLLLFRLTCYYYRKAYYRAFWLSPPACAVAEPHSKYTGETRFPLLGQNLHRYFFYAAALISLINTYDAIVAFVNKDGSFGLGLGNIILVANVVLLWRYTASCHSCRSDHRRPAQPLLEAPGALQALGLGLGAEHEAHAAGVDDARVAGDHGLLHHGRLGRMVRRPADRGVTTAA